MTDKLSKNQKICLFLLSLHTLLAVAFFLYFGGVAQSGDQGRYLFGADNILNSRPLQERQASYLSYILILSLFKGAGLPLVWLIIFQWGLSAVALILIYKMSARLCFFPATILGPLFFLFTDIQRWNQNILTDSLYISSVIILVYLLMRLSEEIFSWKRAAGTILIGFFTIFIRPNGWSFIPILPATLLLLPGISKAKKTGIVFFTVCLIGILVTLVSKYSVGQDMYYGWATQGEVIWSYAPARISMPPPQAGMQGTETLVYYILANPFAYLKLFFIRIFTELSHYRVFYSSRHNTFSIFFVLTNYTLGGIGLYLHRKTFLAQLILAVCFFHIGIIGVTFADWDGRFLMHFFPLLLPFVSAGFSHIIQSVSVKRMLSL